MAYILPNFNLLFELWRWPNNPSIGGFDFDGLACQVYLHSKADIDMIYPDDGLWVPPIYLRAPIDLPVRPQPLDVIRVVYLDDDYYRVTFTQNIHMGFPNEYYFSAIKQCDNAGNIAVR